MSKKEAQGESGGSIRSIKTKKRRNDHHSSEDNKNNRPKAGVWDMLNAKTSKLPRLEFGFFSARKEATDRNYCQEFACTVSVFKNCERVSWNWNSYFLKHWWKSKERVQMTVLI